MLRARACSVWHIRRSSFRAVASVIVRDTTEIHRSISALSTAAGCVIPHSSRRRSEDRHMVCSIAQQSRPELFDRRARGRGDKGALGRGNLCQRACTLPWLRPRWLAGAPQACTAHSCVLCLLWRQPKAGAREGGAHCRCSHRAARCDSGACNAQHAAQHSAFES